MSLPRYPKYKDSEVQWLGRVPEHWGVGRLKNLLAQRITDGPHTTPTFVDEGVPFLSVDAIQDGELRFEGCRYVSDTDHGEFRKKALPRRGDLLMGKAASTGKLAQVKVDFEFSIWSPLALIRLSPSTASPSFFEQWLKSPVAQAQIDNLCTANTQKNISMDDIPRLTVTLPPLQEQIQISAFLDYETSKIDALVAEQERLIELLKEKRQAVISHAVTKGLNLDVPMKDSGVGWLGNVPAHWDVKKFKSLSSIISKGTTPTTIGADFTEHGIRFLKAENVTELGVSRFPEFYIAQEAHAALSRSALQGGDVLVVIAGATTGKSAVLDDSLVPANTNQAVSFIRPLNKAYSPYISLWLSTKLVRDWIGLTSVQSAQPNLSMEDLGNIPIPVPPPEELSCLMAKLGASLGEFSALTTEAQRAIDLLQERRTALISAAVTGQIDVREAAGRAA